MTNNKNKLRKLDTIKYNALKMNLYNKLILNILFEILFVSFI